MKSKEKEESLRLQTSSNNFYRKHLSNWVDLSIKQTLTSEYFNYSSPDIRNTDDAFDKFIRLISGKKGVDIGCGPEARDVYRLFKKGFDIYGLDILKENLKKAKHLHPEIKGRLMVGNIRSSLPFNKSVFDFIICGNVIQHVTDKIVYAHVFSEFSRILKQGGVLYLEFKIGEGINKVFDPMMKTERIFQLYNPRTLVSKLKKNRFSIGGEKENEIKNVITYEDVRGIPHALVYARLIK